MTLGVTLAMLRGLHEGANDGGVGIDLVGLGLGLGC